MPGQRGGAACSPPGPGQPSAQPWPAWAHLPLTALSFNFCTNSASGTPVTFRICVSWSRSWQQVKAQPHSLSVGLKLPFLLPLHQAHPALWTIQVPDTHLLLLLGGEVHPSGLRSLEGFLPARLGKGSLPTNAPAYATFLASSRSVTSIHFFMYSPPTPSHSEFGRETHISSLIPAQHTQVPSFRCVVPKRQVFSAFMCWNDR